MSGPQSCSKQGVLDSHVADFQNDPDPVTDWTTVSDDAAVADFVRRVHLVRVVNHVLLEGAPYLLPIAEYLCLDMI